MPSRRSIPRIGAIVVSPHGKAAQRSGLRELLGGSRAWHIERGDALTLVRQLPEACVDAIVTDQPYSSGGAFRGDRSATPAAKYVQTGVRVKRPDFPGDTRDQRGYLAWCALWLSECRRVAKPGSPIALFSDWRQLPTVTDALQAGGFVWRGIVPWDKTGQARQCKGRFAAQSEFVVWGSKGAMPIERGVGALPGAYRYPVRLKDKHHLCGKLVELMRELVKICAPGGLVLDPFAGSSSTGVACLAEGYRFLGMEETEAYQAISVSRLVAAAAAS